jgi:hypothetical protein
VARGIAYFYCILSVGDSLTSGRYYAQTYDPAFLRGSTGVDGDANIAVKFSLSQNYPNPFNPVTNLQFSIANSQLTVLKVYDVLGREVATLVNEQKLPGTYAVQFNANNLASGVYFYRLQAGQFSDTKKLLILR